MIATSLLLTITVVLGPSHSASWANGSFLIPYKLALLREQGTVIAAFFLLNLFAAVIFSTAASSYTVRRDRKIPPGTLRRKKEAGFDDSEAPMKRAAFRDGVSDGCPARILPI